MIKGTADEEAIGSSVSAGVLAREVTISPASAGIVGSRTTGGGSTSSTSPLEVSSVC